LTHAEKHGNLQSCKSSWAWAQAVYKRDGFLASTMCLAERFKCEMLSMDIQGSFPGVRGGLKPSAAFFGMVGRKVSGKEPI
jgi:hypothetical protein